MSCWESPSNEKEKTKIPAKKWSAALFAKGLPLKGWVDQPEFRT